MLSLKHQEAVKLSKKSKLGKEAYKQLVVKKTSIGQSLKCMCNSDCKSLNVKFNCAYYLAKHERPHSDYSILLSLHKKNRVKLEHLILTIKQPQILLTILQKLPMKAYKRM